MEMLRQDIELYAQSQREAHLQIKKEVLNLTADAFMAGNPCASLEIMSQVMINLDNLKLGQDLLLHQVDGHWEALTDAARELYHGAGVEKQLTPHLITTYSEMVKIALAFEAANETVDKIRGKSGEGSSDRKRKYESGNTLKVQQAAKKASKALVEVLLEELLEVLLGAVVVAPATTSISAHVSTVAAILEVNIADIIHVEKEKQFSCYTHRPRKPELCLLPSVDNPFLAVDRAGPVIQLGMTLKGLSAEWTDCDKQAN
ncbi:hypothetical protein Taro_035767 [Colocasia esculenta]|uniref:Uncharacterized protein n=1 Tax=Colocasia esculenta TaxID=4460 RepID=A0A843WFT2_COLES|nr:hypothetical protein [Colocasia esculenta]